ncbi:SDR family NAD(P)-dependent oxidoreductase, partial [Streptomyces fulvoviolaceus]|uniref:SDR family NAD(P)-dependent oxidoreductase n=1 Tax=Streptomyces fulvoviolaceus TaxID=285535 RepID=UPI0005BA2F47
TARTTADLEELESELAGKVLVLPGSVADSTAVRTMVEQITEWTGRLDGAVNCAGISPHFTRSERVTDEDWQHVLDINLQGTFYCCREAGKIMLEQGSGSIVNVSSVHASTGFERIAAYAASKGGVEALT